MAISSIGSGSQVGDGNLNEVKLGSMAAPQTATTTATLTVAQVTGGMLVASPGTSAATYTFPTAAQLDTLLVNLKVGSTFDLVIVNTGTSSGALTLTMGTGCTLSGSATVAITSSAQLRFRQSSCDPMAFVVYRVA